MHDIKLNNPVARDMKDFLNQRPEERVILRCLECQTFLVPSEIHVLVSRDRVKGEGYKSDIRELCPVCHPNPEAYQNYDEEIISSPLFPMNRLQFERVWAFEKAGLVLPEETSLITVAN